MGSVVGTGCMAASVIGSFAAVEADYAKAAASALACYGIAGEIAAQNAKGPGTFKENFFDALYNLSSEEIKSKIKVDES
jgi:hydroxyethylthiazole kinase